MSIVAFIEEVCVQDAVYWEYDGPDRYGQASFKAPADVKCRWDEKTEVMIDSNGTEFMMDAELLVPQDLTEQSMIMLGTVAGLPVDTDPNKQDDAFEIKRMNRFPLFKGKEFEVFQAFLGRR